jgi:hypothetical protein
MEIFSRDVTCRWTVGVVSREKFLRASSQPGGEKDGGGSRARGGEENRVAHVRRGHLFLLLCRRQVTKNPSAETPGKGKGVGEASKEPKGALTMGRRRRAQPQPAMMKAELFSERD